MNNARLYEKIHHLSPGPITAEVLREFAPRLRWRATGDAGEAVLDVGSGTGLVTRSMLLPLLPARVRTVVGADLAPEMVRHAQTAHAHADPRLRFVQADIEGADCAPRLRAEAGVRSFSAIFSFLCLQWVQDQRTALRNIHQLLHPKGESLLAFFAQSPYTATLEGIAKQSKWQPYLSDVPNYACPYKNSADPGRDFSHLLSEVGFHAVDCRWVQQSQKVQGMNVLTEYLTSVNPFFERIPEDRMQEFKEDIVEEFLRQKQVTVDVGKTSDTTINISYSLLIALLEKKEQ